MNKLKCLICGGEYRHLGSHLWHKHKVLAREYKEEYGLPYKMSLISEDIKEKKRIAFEADRDTYINNLKKGGEKYKFKKGHSGLRRISEHERKVVLKRIQDVNNDMKPEECPVCHMVFDHLPSHLANKHKLISVKKLI